MTTDLAERPPVALARERRVETALSVAEQFAAATMHELSTARQLGCTNDGMRPFPGIASDFDGEAAKRRKEIRAAMKAAGDAWSIAMATVRFIKDFEGKDGAPPEDAPVDPATRKLIEDAEKKRRDTEERRGRVEETLERAGAMRDEIPDPFSG